MMSVTGLRAVYAPAFLDFLPRHFGARAARAHGALLRAPPERDNPYAHALLLGETQGTRRARDERRASSSCSRTPRPTSKPATPGELRRVHPVEHPRRRKRRPTATPLRRGPPRRDEGRRRRAPKLRRAFRRPREEPCRTRPLDALGRRTARQRRRTRRAIRRGRLAALVPQGVRLERRFCGALQARLPTDTMGEIVGSVAPSGKGATAVPSAKNSMTWLSHA